MKPHIIGKYKVVYNDIKNHTMLTDNPREAVWEANKNPKQRMIQNICGSRQFYLDGDVWKSRNID